MTIDLGKMLACASIAEACDELSRQLTAHGAPPITLSLQLAALLARPEPIEPGQHMVEALARIVDRGDNGEDTARAVLSRLASMGEEDMPCVDEIVAHVEPDPDVDISDLRDDIAAAVAFIDARVLPILAAKDAEINKIRGERQAYLKELHGLIGALPGEKVHEAAVRVVARIAELKAIVSDAPIADPAERARLVARELRRRGIACRSRGIGVECVASGIDYDMRFHAGGPLGPRTIADEIQREEAKRAQAWAGDT